MSEIDKNIIEYDISNLKKNIKNLMKEVDIDGRRYDFKNS